MKIVIILNLVLISISLAVYQNCSPVTSVQGEQTSSLNLQSLYPYDETSVYFDDIQLVGKDLAGGIWNYQFAASIVKIDAEDQLVDVDFLVYNSADELVCPRLTETVNRSNNHINFLTCESAQDLKLIKIVVQAADQGQPKQTIRTHILKL